MYAHRNCGVGARFEPLDAQFVLGTGTNADVLDRARNRESGGAHRLRLEVLTVLVFLRLRGVALGAMDVAYKSVVVSFTTLRPGLAQFVRPHL